MRLKKIDGELEKRISQMGSFMSLAEAPQAEGFRVQGLGFRVLPGPQKYVK